MNTYKMITPNEILEQRQKQRQSGILAHSPNNSGLFYPRDGCTCYTCRDALDPTGEEDAKLQNDMTGLATCSDCSQQHSSEEICRPRSLSLNLPCPSPATRAIAAPSGLISPLAGFLTPRSLSDTPVTMEEQVKICEEMEKKVVRYLKRLLKQYERLEELINSDPSDKTHDEMAAYDMWSSEIDDKMASTEDLLNVLKNE